MDRQTVLLIVALFVAIVAGMFIFSYINRADTDTVTPPVTVTPEVPAPVDNGLFARIDAKHFYSASLGLHTVAGELPMPTPCDLLNTNTVLLDDGKRAVISFDVINNSEGLCAQVITPQRFKATFKASKDIKIEAVHQGKQIPLNLIEAGKDEDPADFELFLKG